MPFKVGDTVDIHWPLNPDSVDQEVMSFGGPDIKGATIVALYSRRPEQLYTVAFLNGVQWTCRAKWFEPEKGPW